jgi:aminomethyltransferase
MALDDYPRIDDYGDAAAEARECRANCALLDFSFLECARVSGAGASRAVETFTGRSVEMLPEGKILYAVRVDSYGHALADLTVWRTGNQCFEVMSGRRQDITDLLAYAGQGLNVHDKVGQRVVFAIQGPGSLEALRRLGDVGPIDQLQYFNFCRHAIVGIPCTVGRLGYTGEAGFEVIAARRNARDLWQALSAHARPAGFIATDLLRIEAGFVLFQNEFCLPISPEEAGLGKFCQSAGRPAPRLTLITFRAEADGVRWPWTPARDLHVPGSPGEIAVTSACESIIAGGILGLGYVRAGTSAKMRLHDPAATFINIERTAMPLYDTAKQRPRAPWR